jgi:hypothetical protein
MPNTVSVAPRKPEWRYIRDKRAHLFHRLKRRRYNASGVLHVAKSLNLAQQSAPAEGEVGGSVWAGWSAVTLGMGSALRAARWQVKRQR